MVKRETTSKTDNSGADNSGPKAATSSGFSPGRSMPKNFMTPWILLLLKQWSLHGYLLMQHLQNMGFPTVDHATLYKELRNLEKEGFVWSEWQTEGSGPAKRVYSITEAGEEMLQGWSDIVAGYQKVINGFFDMYGQLFGLDMSGQGKSPVSDGSADEKAE